VITAFIQGGHLAIAGHSSNLMESFICRDERGKFQNLKSARSQSCLSNACHSSCASPSSHTYTNTITEHGRVVFSVAAIVILLIVQTILLQRSVLTTTSDILIPLDRSDAQFRRSYFSWWLRPFYSNAFISLDGLDKLSSHVLIPSDDSENCITAVLLSYLHLGITEHGVVLGRFDRLHPVAHAMFYFLGGVLQY
jgi:hypothetical protein